MRLCHLPGPEGGGCPGLLSNSVPGRSLCDRLPGRAGKDWAAHSLPAGRARNFALCIQPGGRVRSPAPRRGLLSACFWASPAARELLRPPQHTACSASGEGALLPTESLRPSAAVGKNETSCPPGSRCLCFSLSGLTVAHGNLPWPRSPVRLSFLPPLRGDSGTNA